MRLPVVPRRKPDLLDEVGKLVGPAVEAEVADQTRSRHFLNDLDRKADEFAKRK